ncbi:MAG TPA: hypothetical protein DCP20_05095, partial [Coriobacteriia bacterium]|nr:hypothetical protein [Coriobacteriia bacterium]
MLCSLIESPRASNYGLSWRVILHARRTRTIAGIASAALLLAAFASVAAAAGPSGLCGSCHAMRPYAGALAEGEHASMGCTACHAPTSADRMGMAGRVVTRMLPAAVMGAAEVTGPGEGVA